MNVGLTVQRSITEPDRDLKTYHERWQGSDRGLITCWEVGRRRAQREPELAEKAKNGELPPLGWKGGVENKLKAGRKIGTLFYLAQWQGLRGEDLDICFSDEPEITCARTGVTVTFTGDYQKYANA